MATDYTPRESLPYSLEEDGGLREEMNKLSWAVMTLKTHLLYAADVLDDTATKVLDIPTALRLRALAAQFRSEARGKVKP